MPFCVRKPVFRGDRNIFPSTKQKEEKQPALVNSHLKNVPRETFERKSSSEHSRPKNLTENMEIYKKAAEAQASSRYDFAGDPPRAPGPAVPNSARTKGQAPCPLSAFVSPMFHVKQLNDLGSQPLREKDKSKIKFLSQSTKWGTGSRKLSLIFSPLKCDETEFSGIKF